MCADWSTLVTQFLRGHGFAHNPVNPCAMNETVNGAQITLIMYGNDVLVEPAGLFSCLLLKVPASNVA